MLNFNENPENPDDPYIPYEQPNREQGDSDPEPSRDQLAGPNYEQPYGEPN